MTRGNYDQLRDTIPSEFIEPFLVSYISYQLESTAFGFRTHKQVVADLEGLQKFVSLFCGIHSRYAMNNEVYKIKEMHPNTWKAIAKKVVLKD